MTVLQERKTTGAFSMRMKRTDWLNLRNKERELWIAQHQKIGELTLTGAERGERDWFITWVCSCGVRGKSRWSDLKARVDYERAACRGCVSRTLMLEKAKDPKFLARLKDNGVKASNANRKSSEWKELISLCRGAKQRCTNKNCKQWGDYGGRGIEFRFETPTAMALWISDNLGYRPDKHYSIDRIDNNRHYEAGNLRWATRKEQNSNKRAYKLGATGTRIQRLLPLCSYSYESIRTFIKQGLTDDEIINRKKSDTGRPRSKTCLRPCKRGKKEQVLG